MVYPALLPLMRTPRLPVVNWADAPAGLNGLVRFAERRNLVSARVPRGELSYLAPLGIENISAPYFKQCFCSRRDMIAVECLSTPQLSYRDADIYT